MNANLDFPLDAGTDLLDAVMAVHAAERTLSQYLLSKQKHLAYAYSSLESTIQSLKAAGDDAHTSLEGLACLLAPARNAYTAKHRELGNARLKAWDALSARGIRYADDLTALMSDLEDREDRGSCLIVEDVQRWLDVKEESDRKAGEL